MIHLYRWDNDNFNRNGDVILMPVSCLVTAGINRTWQVDLLHPIDEEGRWRSIEVGAVLKTPSFNGTQLWRIVQTSKGETGVTATCDPIYYDAAQYVVFPEQITLENKTPKEIMDILSDGTIFDCVSDITDRETITFENNNLVNAVTGSERGVVKSFDCEIGFDNYTLQIMSQLGEDKGAKVLYGKNLQADGITESVNIDGTVTRLIPIAYNNYKLPELYVDSPLIDQYSMPRVGFKVYEHLRLKRDKVNGEEPDTEVRYFDTEAQLYQAMREEAAKEYSENELDRPNVNIEVNMVLLRQTEEYKDYKDLETISIGDYVTCKHNRLGIEKKTRVRKLVYDCVLEDVVEVELGDPKRRYFDNVSSVVEAASVAITPQGSVVAERVEGTMDGSIAQMKVQNTSDSSKFARLIFVEDLNTGSPTYGAISLGTPGLQLSNEREGNDWKWETAVTPDGIIADLITAGTLKGIEIISKDEAATDDVEVYINDGAVSSIRDDLMATLHGGMLGIYDNNQLRTEVGTFGLTTVDDYHMAGIRPSGFIVDGDDGITDSVTIGSTTLEFKGGILVGVS